MNRQPGPDGYPIGANEPTLTEIGEHDLARHFLQGPCFMTEAAATIIKGTGLDAVLRWFNTPGQRIEVGEARAIGDAGLVACFGFDANLPNGRAFYVIISAGNERPGTRSDDWDRRA